MQCHTIKIIQKLDIYNRFKNASLIWLRNMAPYEEVLSH